MQAHDDAELVRRALSADRSAEALLYRRHAARIARTAARLLRSHSEAQDVVHDTFIAAFSALEQLRDPRGFAGWLLQISIRLAHRRLRRDRLLRRLGFVGWTEDACLAQLAESDAPPEVRAELALLDALLQRMRSAQRIAWMLRRVDGYRLEEVAEACDVSLATAKRWISAADALVRAHVNLEEADDA